MSDNCGFRDGVMHMHSGRCYEAGRREVAASVRGLAAELEREAKSDRSEQRAAAEAESEYWAGCADTAFDVAQRLRALLGGAR